MKVCYFAHSANLSGASLSLVNVICEMQKRNVVPYVVLPEHGDMEKKLSELSVRYFVIPSMSTTIPQGQRSKLSRIVKYAIKRINNAVAINKACHVISDIGVDIIHINGLSQTVGAEVARKLCIPYIWHIREFLEEDHHTEFFDKKRSYKLIANAHTVIAISNAIRDKFEKELDSANIHVIYNGVPIEKYEINAEHSFQSPVTRLLIAGRISEPKGQLCAVKATGIVKNAGHDVKLVIAGSGFATYENAIREYIRNNSLEDSVEFLGFCDDMTALRKDTDIGLLCSECEAFGRVTIETMLANTLFIGTKTGGTTELVCDGETGYLYGFDNAEELAEKIEYAITHKEDMKKVIAAGKAFAESFSIKRNCDSIYSVYESVKIQGEDAT